MISLVQFKLVFRGEAVWINPAEVRSVHKRVGGSTAQACIRFTGLPDSAELVVEGSAEDAVTKLMGGSVSPRIPARARAAPLNSEDVQALMATAPARGG